MPAQRDDNALEAVAHRPQTHTHFHLHGFSRLRRGRSRSAGTRSAGEYDASMPKSMCGGLFSKYAGLMGRQALIRKTLCADCS